ncbi:SOS response-associated peptidase [uncultured Roseibium sp.]|uniref:SOS response-associated peptidase n=1 Tax=uncultured Roseibium sp. TaxID=1936171 RepID=UPI002592EC9A|nr:SOS response-associated peptidase [uncultured Roseibium sp.]
MCGRFTLTATPNDVRALFDYIEQPNFPPRFNIAPTQPVATVRQEHGGRHFALVRWGLIPPWVKDPASFTLLINARSETAEHKPSFRGAMRHHRCLFPVSGFYEWRRTAEGKQPYFIRPADGGLMAFAGLWEIWSDPDGGDIDTGAILTTDANQSVRRIHHRMPAILMPEDFDTWLDTGNVMARDASQLLKPAPEDYLVADPVSTRVNSVANDDASLLEIVTLDPGEAAGQKTKAAKNAAKDQLDLF